MGAGRIPVFFAVAAFAGATAGEARGALFFLFEPTAAKAGDVVTARTGGTPKSFTLRQRVRPFQRPIRLYLVPNQLARDVHNRFDQRAHFVGSLVPDRNGRGLLRFTVPPLESDRYTVGAWCPGCAPYSRGRTWSVIHVTARDVVPRYRPLMLLRVTVPPAKPCPVTRPNGGYWHRNGFLSARVGTGVFEFTPDRVGPDGTLFEKQIWRASGVWGDLIVRFQRLDVPGPALTAQTVSGHDRSWAARLRFPSEGCWKVTGRLDDITLSFVVKVLIRSAG